jgi:hypothetical protein
MATFPGSKLIKFTASLLGIGGVDRSLHEKLSDHISVGDFGAKGNGTADDTNAFKAAVAYVQNIVTTQNSGYPTPSIMIPSGIYKLTDTINIFPWTRFMSEGSVTLDFSGLVDTSKNGIVCRNEQTTIPLGNMKFGTKSSFLNGTRGTICIQGPGKATSTGWGIVVGNTTTSSSPIRDTGGEGVIVTGWRGALKYDPINTYLITWKDCRFEQNQNESVYVSLASGSVMNSGERMTFINCTFAAASNALYHNCDGFNYEFIGCSFDYHTVPFLFGPQGRYTSLKVTNAHIEAFDGAVVDASGSGQYVEVIFSAVEILPTAYVNTSTVVCSPSRTLFKGNSANTMRLAINGMNLLYTIRPYLADTPIIDDNVQLVGLNGVMFRSWYGVLSRSKSLGRDYGFTANTLGTSADALTYWVRDTGTGVIVSVDVRDIQTSTLGQSLHLHGTDASLSTITFHTVDTFVCTPGQIFYPNCDVYADGTTGNLGVRVFVRFYDYSGALVTPTSDFGTTYLLSDLYADASVPTFSSGRTRAVAINGGIVIAPPFAATCRVYLTVSQFLGDVYIKNVRAT